MLTLNFSGYQFLVNAEAGSFGELSYAYIFHEYPLTEQSVFFKLAEFSGVNRRLCFSTDPRFQSTGHTLSESASVLGEFSVGEPRVL